MMLIVPQINFAQTAGPNYPLATGNQPLDYCSTCSGPIWSNTNNIATEDGQYSYVQLASSMFCYQDSCFRSRYLTCNNFNFSVPSTSVILGVEASVNGFCDMSMSVLDQEIRLTQGIVPFGDNMASPSFWATTDSVRYYGNSSCLWGVYLSPEDVNDPEFGVYLKVYNSIPNTSSVFIDEVSIKITYALGTEILSTIQSPNPIYVTNNYLNGDLDVIFTMPQGSDEADLYLYDIAGKECFSSRLENRSGEKSELHINTDGLNSGAYLIKVTTKDNIYLVKTLLAK